MVNIEEIRAILDNKAGAALPESTATPAASAPRPKRGSFIKALRKSTTMDEAVVLNVVKTPDTVGSEREGDPPIIAACRKIVANQQGAKVGGVLVDMFSASAAVQIYDRISPENQKKMASLKVRPMMNLVYKLLAKTS